MVSLLMLQKTNIWVTGIYICMGAIFVRNTPKLESIYKKERYSGRINEGINGFHACYKYCLLKHLINKV